MELNDFEFNCPDCSQQYDTVDRIPRILNCGHTFCSYCISQMSTKEDQQSTFNCPLDNAEVAIKRLNLYPKNLALIKCMEKMKLQSESDNLSTQDKNSVEHQSYKSEENLSVSEGPQEPVANILCQTHKGQRLEVICISCSTKICAKCALFGLHQGHEIRQEEDLILELTGRAEETLKIMSIIDEQSILRCQEVSMHDAMRELEIQKQDKRAEIEFKFGQVIESVQKCLQKSLDIVDQKFDFLKQSILNEIQIPSVLVTQSALWRQEAQRHLNELSDIGENGVALGFLKREGSLAEDIVHKGERLCAHLDEFRSNLRLKLSDLNTQLSISFKPEGLQEGLDEFFSCKLNFNQSSQHQQQDQSLDSLLLDRNNSNNINNNSILLTDNGSDKKYINQRQYGETQGSEEEGQRQQSDCFLIKDEDLKDVSFFGLNDSISMETSNFNGEENNNSNNRLSTITNTTTNNDESNKENCVENETNLLRTSFKQISPYKVTTANGHHHPPTSTGHHHHQHSASISITNNSIISSITSGGGIGMGGNTPSRNHSRRPGTLDKKQQQVQQSVMSSTITKQLKDENGKRKKKEVLKIPQKYEVMFEDLKKGNLEVIDFSNAEFGDVYLELLFEYLPLNIKAKQIKLIRNKMSESSLKLLIPVLLKMPSLQSLNLGQNLLGDQSVEDLIHLMEKHDNLKSVILSQNKINARNVRQRVADAKKDGLTLSL